MNRPLAALFLLLTLPLGLFMVGVVPLGQVPDEPMHATRAASLLHGELYGYRELVGLPDGRHLMIAGITGDPALQNVAHLNGGARTIDGAELLRQRAMRWVGGKPQFLVDGTAAYWPVFYLPATAGIGVMKLLGAGPFQAFLAARLAMLAVFLLAGSAALLLARRGQALLFCALTLPMTLDLAASVNPDGVLIASMSLAVALLTRVGEVAPVPGAVARAPSYWAAAALIGCVAMAKPPYLPFVALLLLPLPPPSETWPGRGELGRRLGAILLIVAATAIWADLAGHAATTLRILDPAEAGPLYAGPRPAIFGTADPAAQLPILLADPTRLITLPLVSLLRDTSLPMGMIGALGWQDVLLPQWMYGLWKIALLAAVVIELSRGSQPGDGSAWLESPLLLLAVAAALFALYLAEYLIWTPVGASWIEGMQGRYLLPLLVLLGVALPRLGLTDTGGRIIRGALWVLPLAAAGLNLLMLPRILVEFYYIA